MAYSQDFRKSALRHLKAAQVLHGWAGHGDQPGCRAVAGYLFGLAGELAVKEIMRNSGFKPGANRRDDPFFAHFPILRRCSRRPTGAAPKNCEECRRIPACSKIGTPICDMHQPRTSMYVGLMRGRHLPSGSLIGWGQYELIA